MKSERISLLKRGKQLVDRYIPEYAQLPLLLSMLWNGLAYYGSNLIAYSWLHHLMNIPADDVIPLLPWTASVYLVCFLFWVVNYILCARQSREQVFRFFSADFLSKMICLAIFVIYPTMAARPEIEGTGFWDHVVRFIYQMDAPVNLFPSMHCLSSWFCYLGIRKDTRIPRWYRLFSGLFAVAVFVSTLTTKQHVIVDVIAGAGLASLTYFIVQPIGFARKYMQAFDWLYAHSKKIF